MYILQYFSKKKLLKQFEYPNLELAQDAIQENDIWNESTGYKIIDKDTELVEEEDEFETTESIRSSMFPDDDSEEGFDVDDFYDNDN